MVGVSLFQFSYFSGDLYSLIEDVRSVLLKRPDRWLPSSAYMWVDRNGRPVSPPSTHPRSPTFKKNQVNPEESKEEYVSIALVSHADAASALDGATLRRTAHTTSTDEKFMLR
ncbi:hypothetical protein AVEN_126076-1 [Araneus ventricosus]|uniref:Uncharacterized protein n=1 Tax=Araneus ventricosus TaxID=182803 RepID=A0A4Y2CKH5_ARAVE|nr:hypothetical protein AVEN_126076-1 [Araneus ventricosus]